MNKTLYDGEFRYRCDGTMHYYNNGMAIVKLEDCNCKEAQ